LADRLPDAWTNRVRAMRPDRGVFRASLGATVLGLAGCVVALLLDADRFYHAWLTAFVFVTGIALGALCLVMIGHVTDARWFVLVRRPAESIAATLPLLAILFLPVLAGIRHLYPWAGPLDALEPHAREAILRRGAWVAPPFFIMRSILYLAAWVILAELLIRTSRRQDTESGPRAVAAGARISAAGLIVFGFTVTFAAFDWLMSLSAEWVSTIFGAYWFAGSMVAALGMLALVCMRLERDGPLAGMVRPDHWYAIGRLMLTFVIFWAYVAYSQGFLVWIANLPREASWYLARWRNGWSVVLWMLIIGHFAIPLALLLSWKLKRRAGPLALLGLWLVAMHFVDMFWLVVPSLEGASALPHWADAAAVLFMGGTAVAFGAWRARAVLVAPVHDPRFRASLAYHSS
jgi:hypothetical protein